MRTLLVLVCVAASLALADELSPEEWKTQLAAQRGLVLDVRTPGEVSKGKIAQASVIDFNADGFERKVSLISRERPVFIYCASGGRSGRAAELMIGKLGFKHVFNLAGGYRAWVAAGLPTEAGGALAVEAKREATTLEAFDAALSKQKRVLVAFQTPWCTPCQQMAPVLDSVKSISVLKIDADASEALAARQHVVDVPQFVLFVEGKEKARLSGVQTKEALEKLAATP